MSEAEYRPMTVAELINRLLVMPAYAEVLLECDLMAHNSQAVFVQEVEGRTYVVIKD